MLKISYSVTQKVTYMRMCLKDVYATSTKEILHLLQDFEGSWRNISSIPS